MAPRSQAWPKTQTPNSARLAFSFRLDPLVLIGALAGGRIYDRLPGHPVLAAGLLGMALTIALTPTISLLWLLVLVVLLLGISESMLDVGTNTMLPWLHHNNVAPYMNGLHFSSVWARFFRRLSSPRPFCAAAT